MLHLSIILTFSKHFSIKKPKPPTIYIAMKNLNYARKIQFILMEKHIIYWSNESYHLDLII
jgi:hypothetical protein